ncbi:MAG TPA: RluA family pseudouridine synthase [Ilumatobacteraceae bacterium]|nr:RluA family pseudouridine synthase [Ilumatobacteraceae bacterium]HRB04396.1 RluA family pseudouridine synthase [Ilumatobacteraceae bacterium]
MIEEEIPAALGGERLDRIVSLMTDCSRSDAAVLVSAGGAFIDDEVHLIGKIRVREGQIVRVDPAFLPVTEPPAADPTVEFTVVYSDDHLIIIDKPAGLVVHPGAGNADGTLVNGLLARFPEIADVGETHRPGIVHRLDVGTSGLLAVARTQRAYHALVDALATRNVGRVYRALVWGHLANPVGVVDAPIGRDHRDAMRMAVVVDGKPARTRYRVLQEYRRPTEASALECRLETGRTHQIRVHLAAVGHPVVGDGTYGGIRSGIMPARPFLHAAALELLHPVTGEALTFSSALPADLADVEAALGT